jgi:hypothetical protein
MNYKFSGKQKTAARAVFLLTHLGSNQDSAEPKSDVLPVTPWVRHCLIRRHKITKNYRIFYSLLKEVSKKVFMLSAAIPAFQEYYSAS